MGLENGKGINRDQLVTISDLEDLKTNLLFEIKMLLNETGKLSVKQWLRSAEVRKMLGISGGTLQNFRVNGTLTFTKIGGIVFYKYDEIIKLLENNSTKARSRG